MERDFDTQQWIEEAETRLGFHLPLAQKIVLLCYPDATSTLQ